MSNGVEVAAVSATIGAAVFLVGKLLDAVSTKSQRSHDRDAHLRLERESAFSGWLETVPKLAIAYQRHAQARSVEELEKADLEIARIDGDEIRSVLARLRLFAEPEIVNATRMATRLLREAHLQTPPFEPIDLGPYRAAFTDCLAKMRSAVGSAVAGEQLDPAGIFIAESISDERGPMA